MEQWRATQKSDLEMRWWLSWVCRFSFPLEANWHPDLAMVSTAPTEVPEHLSMAAQVTSQNDSQAGTKTASTWLTEGWESTMTTALQIPGSSSAEWQHRKAARQEKEDICRAHPAIPQYYIGAQFTQLSTQPIFGWLHGKDKMLDKGINDLWGTNSSNQQPWHTEQTSHHLPPQPWQGKYRDTKQ